MNKLRGKILGVLLVACALIVTRVHTRASDVAVAAMSPHMDMTMKRPMQPGDQARADAILAALRAVMQKYANVEVATADGFQEFHPELHAADAHFTNNAYAKEAWSGHFDPSHPTSLMYRRTASGWKIEGAMYTASPSATQAQLDAEVPMSIGTWHRHTNVCNGPPGASLRQYYGAHALFGLQGSIHDEASCVAAGGTWKSQIFGWMLHVWPMQSDPSKIWALHADGTGEGESSMQMKMR